MSHLAADLLAYLDGELSPAEVQSVEAHLSQCFACRAELAELRAVQAGLADLMAVTYDAIHVPAEAEARIRSALASQRARQQRNGSIQQGLAGVWAGLLASVRPLSKAAIPLMAVVALVLTLNAARLPQQTGVQQTLVLGGDSYAPGTQAGLRVLVRDQVDGQPLANADIAVQLRHTGLAKTVYTGSTDASGSAPVQFTVPAEWEGDAELVVNAESDLGADEVIAPIRLERGYRLLLSSDKPVYQPGETIHMRTLALGAVDSRPAAGVAAQFEVLDPQGKPLLQQVAPSTEFGIAAADFLLEPAAMQGQYQLRATLDDTTSQMSVLVSQAEPPDFRVDVRADAPYYLPGDLVSGQVSAHYFYGKPLAGAAVQLRLLASRLNQTAAQGEERLFVKDLRGETNDQGAFAFQFDLPELTAETFGSDGALTVDLEAMVTDLAGQSELGWQKVTVASQPILIDVAPESGTLHAGVENILYVLTSYPDGRPVAASLVVQIGDGAPIETVSSEFGLAEVRFTPRAPGPGDVDARVVQVTATDAAGNHGATSVTLPLDEAQETLLLRSDRAIYGVGDTLALEAVATGAGEAVYLDVIKGGQVLLTQSALVDARRGRATFAIDLTPELAGTLQLSAYQVGADGNILRDTRVAVVDAPEDLQVHLAADRPEYRPGEEAQVTVRTERAGEGVQSGVSLAVVDEAAYAQRQHQPGFARAYFILDKALQESGVALPDTALPGAADMQTQEALRSAQQQAAKASWVSYQGSEPTLAAQSVDQASRDAVNRERQAAFQRLSFGLSLALLLAPTLLAIIVVWGLRRSGVLGKAIGRLLLTVLLLAIGGGVLLLASQSLLARLSEAQRWIVLGVTAGLWLLALLGLLFYGWRGRDPRAQYVALLVLAYAACMALLAVAAGQGALVSTAWLMLLAVAFGVLLAGLLLFGWGLRLEGERRAGLATLLLALWIIPLMASLSAVDLAGAGLVQRIAGPVVYGLNNGWLTGCAAPAAEPAVQELAARPSAAKQTGSEQPAEQAPAAAPAEVSPELAPTLVVIEQVMAPTAQGEAAREVEATPTAAPLPPPAAEAIVESTELPTPIAAEAALAVTPTMELALALAAPLTTTTVVTPDLSVALTATSALTATTVVTAGAELAFDLAALPTETATPEPPPEPLAQALQAGPAPSPAATPEPEPTLAPTVTPAPAPLATPEPTSTAAPPAAAGAAVQRAAPPAAPTPIPPEALPIIRQRFPQTLYWNPQAVSDEQGNLRLAIPTGDSITGWRITALAVDRDGRLGSASAPLIVFQPLFLEVDVPAAMAVGDQAAADVQIFNYGRQPLSVIVTAQASPGLQVELAATSTNVPANDVAIVPLSIQALAAGPQTLTVSVQSGDQQDVRQVIIEVRN